jgi:Putative transposase
MGPRAGQPVRRLRSAAAVTATARRSARLEGFSLHADVAVPAHRRDQLERLCRYLLRPPLALERLTESSGGQLLYQFRRPWRDGSTALVLEPLELLKRLAALVPVPRRPWLAYHGVLAPRARWRAAIIPEPATPDAGDADARSQAGRRAGRRGRLRRRAPRPCTALPAARGTARLRNRFPRRRGRGRRVRLRLSPARACAVLRVREARGAHLSDWRIAGRYFESCNCDAICPCRMVGGIPGGRSTYGECYGVLAWRSTRATRRASSSTASSPR